MYQQRPRPPDSALFNAAKLAVLTTIPETHSTVRAWDLAATVPAPGRDPDYTVGLKAGMTAGGHIVVLDVVRMRGSVGAVEEMIVRTAAMDGRQTMICLPQDPGQAGLAQVNYLRRQLDGYQVHATPETGAKMTRAMPAAAQVDKAAISLLAAPWNDGFRRELEAFPDSAKDDQVDAFSRAVAFLLASKGEAAVRRNVRIFDR
jgi:predicted phage terminase large subunit-like protein